MSSKFSIYDNKVGKIVEFIPMESDKVSMYVCGPTVYNYAHIGNARPVVVFDTMRRVLEADGYTVEYVSNVTDVDDKIIQKAIDEGVDESVITSRYLASYLQLCDDLQVKELAARPKVTETMDQIIKFIELLVDKGYAYQVNGDVYFRVGKIADYGSHGKQNLDDLVVGARIAENSDKEYPLDFALWKASEKGIVWDSSFGKGRPGWHTECVVMIDNYFHQKIDIHGGGMDLKFPHHENEIAQAKAAFNHGIANYWLYNGMLNISGEKMSKSLGNVLWATDFIDKIGANNTRWLLLSANYRAPLNINDELVQQVENELNRIKSALNQSWVKLSLLGCSSDDYNQERLAEFLSCLNDDLNTPNAYAVIFENVKALNQLLRQNSDIGEISCLTNTIVKMLDILGIVFKVLVLDDFDKELYNNWVAAKANKDFALADGLRQQLIIKGIL